jgi:hypothetical protein
VLIIFKSGSLNLLESSGPVQACNGIALPLNVNSQSLDSLLPLSNIKETHTNCNKRETDHKKSRILIQMPEQDLA